MILVTGGTGLVGSHLLFDLVKSGEKVRAIYRSSESLQKVKKVFSYYTSEEKAEEFFARIDWAVADITDLPSLEKVFGDITLVYHCAAVISFDPSKDNLLRKVNIEGTANVVNLCIEHKVGKLCFVSSIATLDEKPGKKEITEESLWNKDKAHDMYAITKYGAEMEVWRASQEGVDVIIVNPGIIIGPGFWDSGSGKIFRRVSNGLNYHFPKITGFVGIWDVVTPMRKLMNSGIRNEQFVLVSDNLSFELVLKEVAESLDKNPPKKRLKPWMVYIGWLLEKSLGWLASTERQLNRRSAEDLFTDHFYSSEKIKFKLSFRFNSAIEAIQKTGEIFAKEVNK